MAAKYLDGINFDSPSAGFQGTLKIRDTEARAMIQDNTNNITSNTAAIQNLQGRTATIEGEQVTQNVRLDGVEAKNEQQDTRLTAIETEQVTQNSRLNAVEDKNTQQDGRLDAIEAEQVVQNGRLTAVEDKNTQQDAQIGALIAKDAEQDGRLDAAEADIVSLEGRMDTAEADIDAIEAKDVLQDAQIADLDDRVAASTYEAGIGIYFGQGVKHTNINVDDELIDQINQNTVNIEILFQTKTEFYTMDGDERVNYPELTIDETMQVVTDGDEKKLRVGKFELTGFRFTQTDLSDLTADATVVIPQIERYLDSLPFDTNGGHSLPLRILLEHTVSGNYYNVEGTAHVMPQFGAVGRAGYVYAIVTDTAQNHVSGGTNKAYIVAFNYNITNPGITGITVTPIGSTATVVNENLRFS